MSAVITSSSPVSTPSSTSYFLSFKPCHCSGRCLGFFCLGTAVILWVISNILIQKLYTGNIYPKPIACTLIQMSTSIIFLIPPLCCFPSPPVHAESHGKSSWCKKLRNGFCLFARRMGETRHCCCATSPSSLSSYDDEMAWWGGSRMLELVMAFGTLWIATQITFNLSLDHCTVPTNSVLCSTSSFFALFFSVIFLGEKVSCFPLLSVILSFFGVLVMSLNHPKPTNTSQVDDEVVGCFLAVASAVLYALFVVLFKKAARQSSVRMSVNDVERKGERGSANMRVCTDNWEDGAEENGKTQANDSEVDVTSQKEEQGVLSNDNEGQQTTHTCLFETTLRHNPPFDRKDEEDTQRKITAENVEDELEENIEALSNAVEIPVDVSLFFGLNGVLVMIISPLLLLFFHLIHIESFEPISSLSTLGVLLLMGLLGTALGDFLWAKSLTLLSPLIATIGLNLQIPLSIWADGVLFKNHAFSWWYVVGTVLVVTGVVLLSLSCNREEGYLGLKNPKTSLPPTDGAATGGP